MSTPRSVEFLEQTMAEGSTPFDGEVEKVRRSLVGRSEAAKRLLQTVTDPLLAEGYLPIAQAVVRPEVIESGTISIRMEAFVVLRPSDADARTVTVRVSA